MTHLSKNFTRQEFACRCGCGFDTVDAELVTVLQDLRQHFGKPVRITSGCRCSEYNAKVNGAPGSLHLRGRAADVVVDSVSSFKVQQYLMGKYTGMLGIGSSRFFTHVDTRSGQPARWTYGG